MTEFQLDWNAICPRCDRRYYNGDKPLDKFIEVRRCPACLEAQPKYKHQGLALRSSEKSAWRRYPTRTASPTPK